MQETNIMRMIQKEASKHNCRLFRNNTGMAWTGERIIKFSEGIVVRVNPGDILIRQGRPVKFGLIDGGSDLIGWAKKGEFLAVEVKSERGVATTEQANFIDAVNAAGGIGMIARSTEEFINKIN